MSGKHTPGPWSPSKFGFQVLTGDSWNTICTLRGGAEWEDGRGKYEQAYEWENQEANARLIAAAPDLLDCAKLAEQTVHRSKSITAPEDIEIEHLCERLGYGAVMDAAARLWVRKDPIGALTVGPCVATVQSAIAKAEGRAP